MCVALLFTVLLFCSIYYISTCRRRRRWRRQQQRRIEKRKRSQMKDYNWCAEERKSASVCVWIRLSFPSHNFSKCERINAHEWTKENFCFIKPQTHTHTPSLSLTLSPTLSHSCSVTRSSQITVILFSFGFSVLVYLLWFRCVGIYFFITARWDWERARDFGWAKTRARDSEEKIFGS